MRERLCTLGCWSAKPRLGAAAYNTTRGKFASRPSTSIARVHDAHQTFCADHVAQKKSLTQGARLLF